MDRLIGSVHRGATSSGKCTGERTFELTDKIKGKIAEHSSFQVTEDGKTMTVTAQETGQPNAATYVYDKL